MTCVGVTRLEEHVPGLGQTREDRMTDTKKILFAATALLLSGGAMLCAASAQEITRLDAQISAIKQANEAMNKIATDFEAANPGSKVTIVDARHRRSQDRAARRSRLRQGSRHLFQLGWPRSRRRICEGWPQPAARQILHGIQMDRRTRSVGRLVRRHLSGRQARRSLHVQGRGRSTTARAASRRPALPKSRKPMTSCLLPPRS